MGPKQIQFVGSFFHKIDPTSPKLKFLSSMPELRRDNNALIRRHFEDVEKDAGGTKRVIGVLAKSVSSCYNSAWSV